MNSSEIRILVVDDEADIRKILKLMLKSRGYEVLEAANGVQAIECAVKNNVDLIIMDIMMPQMSGIEATREIRKSSVAPILFLTAKSLDRDKEAAYMSGGDDYLVKPFSSAELIMKVESLLRRYTIYKGKESSSEVLSLACGIEVDIEKKTVRKNGEEVILRDRESEIFFYLLEHRGETIESDTIFEDVWGEKVMPSSANNVMVNMLGLRKKLEDDPARPKIIRTVWGKGYQFV